MFYGHIPEELTELVNLQYLDLAYNNITGNIPKSIVNCKGMIATRDNYDDGGDALHRAFGFNDEWEHGPNELVTYTENFTVVK